MKSDEEIIKIFKKKMKKVVSLKVKACILSTGESQGK